MDVSEKAWRARAIAAVVILPADRGERRGDDQVSGGHAPVGEHLDHPIDPVEIIL